MLSNLLDRISFLALLLVIVLLPVFVLPFTRIPVEISKGLLLVIGLAVSIIFWTVARFSDGKISLPKSPIILSGLFIVVSVFLSAFFSSASQVSFFGTMFDMGTFWFIFSAFLLMFISSVVIRDSKKARTVFVGVVLSSAVVLIFQAVHMFFPQALSLGILGSKTDNILGSWNSFGIFAGLFSIMSVLVLEFLSLSRVTKIILWSLTVLALFMVASVNFLLIWKLLGIFALIIFVYKISFSSTLSEQEKEKTNFPVASFIVVMVSLLFFMSSQFIGSLLPNKLGLSNIEVRPSFASTMLVTGKALSTNPILGVGPNRFSEVWSKYKPKDINNSIFWDTPFESGSGLLPTFASTTGYLGILAWLTFFVLFLMLGVKTLFSSIKKGVHLEMTGFFLAALYLFVVSFLYPSGPVIFLLALAFSGIFIGVSSVVHHEDITLTFSEDPRKSFFSILLMVVLMITTAAMSFKYIERFASVSYFNQTLSAQSFETAEASIRKAVSLYTNDLYLRTYAQVYLLKLNSIVSKGSDLSETDKADLKTSFDQSIFAGTDAERYNPSNYLNLQMLGSLYQTFGGVGVTGAFDKAIESYQKASILNPNNPGIKLSIARTYMADGKNKEAKDFAKQALELKPDLIDTLITLSQIAKIDGENSIAVSYAEQALSLAPANKDLIQYVKTLKGGGNAVAPAPTVNPTLTPTPDNKTTTTPKKTP